VPPDLGAGTETTQYVYDADDALVQVLRPNSQVIEFLYDAAGRVETIESPEGTTEVTYNPATGHVSEFEGPGGGRILYSYNGSLVTEIQTTGVNAAVLSWTYDDDMRRETTTVAGATYPMAYDDDGLLLSIGAVEIDRVPATGFASAVIVDEVETAIDFDATDALAGLSSEYDSTERLSFVYERDEFGRIVSVTETPIAGSPPDARVTEYEYDLGGRLEMVTTDGVVADEYAYDDNGNRESVTTPGGTVTAFFDAHGRMVEHGEVELEYAVTGELLMRVDGVAVTQFEHDAFGRLVAVELPDATLIEYDLDARSRRVGRRVDSVLERAWVYDGQLDPVAELDGADSRRIRPNRSGAAPARRVRRAQRRRRRADHRGNRRGRTRRPGRRAPLPGARARPPLGSSVVWGGGRPRSGGAAGERGPARRLGHLDSLARVGVSSNPATQADARLASAEVLFVSGRFLAGIAQLEPYLSLPTGAMQNSGRAEAAASPARPRSVSTGMSNFW